MFTNLPKTSTGKIQKFVLRDMAKQLNQEGRGGQAVRDLREPVALIDRFRNESRPRPLTRDLLVRSR